MLRWATRVPPKWRLDLFSSFCTAYSRQFLHFLHSKLALLIWTPSNTWFPGPTRVHIPNSLLIASSIFAGLMIMTDRPRYSICNNSPHLHSTAMRSTFFQSIFTHLAFYICLCCMWLTGSNSAPNKWYQWKGRSCLLWLEIRGFSHDFGEIRVYRSLVVNS